MRKFLLLPIYLIIIFSCVKSHEMIDLPVLNSNNKILFAYLNNDTTQVNWANLPKLDKYRNHIECLNEQNPVLIISDMDTISFNIKPNDTIRFYLSFNNEEKALVEMIGVPKNVHFSEEYIHNHKNKIAIEIPEVHELANILVAISKIGQKDVNMVEFNTSYHKEVLKHFLSYSNHPIMDTINANITDSKVKSYWYYYALKMNACGYVFDNKGQIINQGIVRKLGFDGNVDPLVRNARLMEDFVRKSNFREFYKNHKSYYDSLIVVYKHLNPISKMKNWLENKFGIEYGNYTVFFSPLVGGAHSTNRFSDNGFEQTFMFVSSAGNRPSYNANVNEMLASRVVFTEIDHNFVNPVSDKKIDAIKKAFFNRDKWTSDSADKSAYNNGCSVFNEYMTWGLFSLYCLDFFPNEDVKQFIPMMEEQMVSSRHFVKFKEFNQQLIKLYENNPKISINDLYDKVLQWCMDEHNYVKTRS